MPDFSNPGSGVDLKEIVIGNVCAINSILELLVEKGILSREEYMDKINQLKAQRNQGRE